MGKVFEVGKMYYRADGGFDPQKIIRRTEKTIISCNAYDNESYTFRQRIFHDENGNEFVIDSALPRRHRMTTLCNAAWEVKE